MLRTLEPFGTASFHAWGPLLVVRFPGVTRLDEMEHWARLQRMAASEHGRIATLSVLSRETIRSGDDVRQLAQRMAAEFRDTTVANAVVVPEQSLFAAGFRSMLTGLSLASRSKVPHSVFRDLPDAVDWLAEHGAVERDQASALVGALEREWSRAVT